jgi:hypothetical protein
MQEDQSPAQGKNMRHYPKSYNSKRDGDVAQVVERLPNKHKALSLPLKNSTL